jgi:hypothetical protein
MVPIRACSVVKLSEQEIADSIIAAAPDKESAAWVKSAIDTGKIVIISC